MKKSKIYLTDENIKKIEAIAKEKYKNPNYKKASVIRNIIDELDLEPAIVFTKENIVKDSWKMEYLLPTSESIDFAEVSYFDERTWTNRTFDVALVDSKKQKKTQMTMFGITNKDQSRRETEYHLLCNKYLRRVMTFDTEMEGGIPTVGSLIRVSFPIPKWGVSGYCKSYNKETLVLEVSEPLSIENNKEYFICLRNNIGKADKVIKVIREDEMLENQVNLSEQPNFELEIQDIQEKTTFIFGQSEEVTIDSKVNSIKARSPYLYTITSTVDDSRVYF